MKLRNLTYALGLLIVLAIAGPATVKAGRLHQPDVDKQSKVFKKWCDSDLVLKFDELPKESMVPKKRIPYAGFIYPDTGGGTANALRKYDMAFNGGSMRASGWEAWDIKATREPRLGLFGLGGGRTPHWAGHCNGWCAASMRHAEPQRSVNRRGVTFTPSDIKGLLAELYTYTDTEILGGANQASINPAMVHIILANWIGNQEQPVAMDSSPGKEIWNYPVYCYRAAAAKRGRNMVEVKMNLGYVYMLDWEENKAPRNFRYKMFHYSLELDNQGNIIGGDYYRDSDHIDMLWVSLAPKQGGTPGNERGCPFISSKEILAMWRESTTPESREAFVNIDPVAEDVIVKNEAPQAEERIATRPQTTTTAPTAVAPAAPATTPAASAPVAPAVEDEAELSTVEVTSPVEEAESTAVEASITDEANEEEAVEIAPEEDLADPAPFEDDLNFTDVVDENDDDTEEDSEDTEDELDEEDNDSE